MQPGERVRLIKRIAAKFADLDWSEIDLTLRTFDLPWSDVWSGNDQRSYAIEMLQDGSDEALVALHDYLREGDSPQPEREPGEPWTTGFRLFITHASAHKEEAFDLKETLAYFGIDGFVAHEDIAPSLEWEEVILRALASCDALVALVHPEFPESEWTDQEVGFCMGRRAFTFSVKLGADPHGFLARYQAVSGLDKHPRALAREIAQVLLRQSETRASLGAALVESVVRAQSFNQAIDASTMLEDEDVALSPNDVRRLLDSVRTNGQVRGAFYVPERIDRLAERAGIEPKYEPEKADPPDFGEEPF